MTEKISTSTQHPRQDAGTFFPQKGGEGVRSSPGPTHFFSPSNHPTNTPLVQRTPISPFSVSEGEAVEPREAIQAKQIDNSYSQPIQSDNTNALRRMQWSTATDTGQDRKPWPSLSYTGDLYEVQTDAGNKINAWKPHDGTTYWCHGYTFGGSVAGNGPFSIWGQDVPTVLADDGWRRGRSCLAQDMSSGRPDILVFESGGMVQHTGINKTTVASGGAINESQSRLSSKWGSAPLNSKTWKENASTYESQYRIYSKNPLPGPCSAQGPNEQ